MSKENSKNGKVVVVDIFQTYWQGDYRDIAGIWDGIVGALENLRTHDPTSHTLRSTRRVLFTRRKTVDEYLEHMGLTLEQIRQVRESPHAESCAIAISDRLAHLYNELIESGFLTPGVAEAIALHAIAAFKQTFDRRHM